MCLWTFCCACEVRVATPETYEHLAKSLKVSAAVHVLERAACLSPVAQDTMDMELEKTGRNAVRLVPAVRPKLIIMTMTTMTHRQVQEGEKALEQARKCIEAIQKQRAQKEEM
eukprot:3639296-Amphidinium_carterae.1